MKSKIDRKKVRKQAKTLINQGKSKQEVYDELVTEYKYRNEIAEIVRYTPTTEKLRKYSIWNTLYLIFISLITLLLLLQPTLGIIWFILLIVIVASKKFKYYYWNSILGLVMIISVVALSLYEGTNDGSETILATIITLTTAIITILAGIILPRKITPKYIEKKEKYLDKNGKEKLRIIHIFE